MQIGKTRLLHSKKSANNQLKHLYLRRFLPFFLCVCCSCVCHFIALLSSQWMFSSFLPSFPILLFLFIVIISHKQNTYSHELSSFQFTTVLLSACWSNGTSCTVQCAPHAIFIAKKKSCERTAKKRHSKKIYLYEHEHERNSYYYERVSTVTVLQCAMSTPRYILVYYIQIHTVCSWSVSNNMALRYIAVKCLVQ